MSKLGIEELALAIFLTRLRLDGKCAFCLDSLAPDSEFRYWHLSEKHGIETKYADGSQ